MSPSVAEEVSAAQLVIQNGIGYDDFMTKIESASPNEARKVIDVQHLLGLPDSTPNPHLWYDPTTMPKVANALAADFAALKPADAAYFNDERHRLHRIAQSVVAGDRRLQGDSTRGRRWPPPSRSRTTCSRQQVPTT